MDLSKKVLDPKGRTATMKADIARSEVDVASNADDVNEASKIRGKDKADCETASALRKVDRLLMGTEDRCHVGSV